jgi:hypothetical protein
MLDGRCDTEGFDLAREPRDLMLSQFSTKGSGKDYVTRTANV